MAWQVLDLSNNALTEILDMALPLLKTLLLNDNQARPSNTQRFPKKIKNTLNDSWYAPRTKSSSLPPANRCHLPLNSARAHAIRPFEERAELEGGGWYQHS